MLLLLEVSREYSAFFFTDSGFPVKKYLKIKVHKSVRSAAEEKKTRTLWLMLTGGRLPSTDKISKNKHQNKHESFIKYVH